LAAREAGAQVLVLEKAPTTTEVATVASRGIVRFAQGGLQDILPLVPDLTEAEIARLEVEPYSAETYLDDIMRLSEGKADPALTRVLVDNSYQTVRWMQSLGVSFELYQTAVRQGDRIYFPAGAVIQFWSGGPGLTNRLFRAAEGRGIDVVYDTPVLDLLVPAEGRVQGVRAQTPEGPMDIHAGAVILACGGFEASDTRRARTWERSGKRSMSGAPGITPGNCWTALKRWTLSWEDTSTVPTPCQWMRVRPRWVT
jgi:tricarballylate dehydrogenase